MTEGDEITGDKNAIGHGSINVTGGTVNIHGDVRQGNRTVDEFGRISMNAYRTRSLRLPATPIRILAIGFSGIAAGLFSVLGNTASVFSAVKDQVPMPIWNWFEFAALPIMGICGSLFLLGFWLKFRSQSVGVPLLGNLEVGSDGYVYLTGVQGECPLCGGKMRMYAASKNSPDHLMVCTRNTNHRLQFDMTTLPDVAEERGFRMEKP